MPAARATGERDRKKEKIGRNDGKKRREGGAKRKKKPAAKIVYISLLLASYKTIPPVYIFILSSVFIYLYTLRPLTHQFLL